MNKDKVTAASPRNALPRVRLVQLLGGPLMLGLTAAVSHFGWQHVSGLLVLPVLTMAMVAVPGRIFPFLVGFVYFYSADWQLARVIARESPDASAVVRLGAPILLTSLQAIPLLLVRSDRSPAERFWRIFCAWMIAALPPFGLVVWMHPALIAGLIFPGLGALGVPLSLLIIAAPAARLSRRPADLVISALISIAFLAAGCSVWHRLRDPVGPMMGWYGVNTHIPPGGRWTDSQIQPKVPGDVVGDAVAAYLPAKVLLFPETTFAPMSMPDKVSALASLIAADKSGTTVLAGASFLTGNDSWRNTLVRLKPTLDDPEILTDARVVMPYGNWKMSGGVSVHPLATDLVQVPTTDGPVSAAVSICYEDTLLWPHLGLLSGRAKVLLSLGNAWATSGTIGDRIQTESAFLLASMAGVPLVRARNEWDGPVYYKGLLR